MIRIEEIHLPISKENVAIKGSIRRILLLPQREKFSFKVIKKALDSRNKQRLAYAYSVNVTMFDMSNEDALVTLNHTDKGKELLKRHRVRLIKPYVMRIPKIKSSSRPLVVGAGPSGLFAGLYLAEAGLNPIIIDRGSEVNKRVEDVKTFSEGGELNTESNVQFGEGGAGTFSDGKLYTLISDDRTYYIFDKLVEAGAPKEILMDAKPHIGTDRLRYVVANIREKIIALGGEFRFDTKLTDISVKEGKLNAIQLNGEEHQAENIILAPGHSARDTFEMLHNRGVDFVQKPFSMGVRIEHLQEMINSSQYGYYPKNSILPPANYKLNTHLKSGRGVYTFCMCPGGYVVPAASEEGGLVTNGMSNYKRDGVNANSAILVSVNPEDFGSTHPLAGFEFQRKYEKLAFDLGGGDYKAPMQLVGDFLNDKVSTEFLKIQPTYSRGGTFAQLSDCLPDYVVEGIKVGLTAFDRKIKGFAKSGAILTGVETRSSSPVRLVRDDNYESSISGIFPAGEGPGYAGGIVSSAVDGLRVAEALAKKLKM